MQPPHRLVLLLALLLITAIGCGRKLTNFAQQEVPDDLLITMEQTGCEGACPHYKVTVTGDGAVTYHGYEFVKVKGPAQGEVTEQQVREILKEFDRADFLALRDTYKTEDDGCALISTDASTTYFSIRFKGRTKSVEDYGGCKGSDGEALPETKPLGRLYRRIDKILDTKQWTEPYDARKGP